MAELLGKLLPEPTTGYGRVLGALAGLLGALLLTYVLTRLVIRIARKATSPAKAALLSFLIVATLTLLITRFTMGADEGFKTYMPCLVFWLILDMARLKKERRQTQDVTMNRSGFKTCPFCKEEIRASAVKCRYCGEWLETPPEGTISQQPRADAEAAPIPPTEADTERLEADPHDERMVSDAETRATSPESGRSEQGEEEHASVNHRTNLAAIPPSGNFVGLVGHQKERIVSQDADLSTSHRPSRVWMVCLAVVCFGIVAYGYFRHENTMWTSEFPRLDRATHPIAVLVGFNLPMAVVIWLIFHVAVGRKRGLGKALVAFLAIHGSLIAGGFLGYSRYSQQEKTAAMQALTRFKEDFSSLVRSSTANPWVQQEPLNTTPATEGEFGEVEQWVKTLVNRLVSLTNDYRLELSAVGWARCLDPERVRQDTDLNESRMMVQKAKEIFGRYRTRALTCLEDSGKDIGTLKVSSNVRQQLATGFDEGRAQASLRIEAQMDSEAKIISEAENVFTLLSARKGTWVIRDGKILFADAKDANAFNSYVAAIQDAASKQTAIREQSIRDVNDALKGAMNELKN